MATPESLQVEQYWRDWIDELVPVILEMKDHPSFPKLEELFNRRPGTENWRKRMGLE